MDKKRHLPHCKSSPQPPQAGCEDQQFYEQWHSLLPVKRKIVKMNIVQ